jgi:hypothetical protein
MIDKKNSINTNLHKGKREFQILPWDVFDANLKMSDFDKNYHGNHAI